MKKLLALVLALVMTLGLATVGANAAYKDADSINYKEAVDVMSAIGVLAGDETGFRPADTLKRSEGAKIVAYLMLGNKTAEAIQASGTKYTDLPANHWAAGYMEYLTSAGVMGGVGDGKIDPDGQLTATAFAKMLLCALGYDAKIEGLGGTDWAINTQKLANQAKLFDGNKDVVGSAAVTREEAALYAFNTIKAPLVQYDTKGTTITIGDASVQTGASAWSYKTSTILKDQTISDDQINNGLLASPYVVEFAEEYYPDLKLTGETDEFNRPANDWTYMGKAVGTYAKTYAIKYTKKTELGEIYRTLGLTTATTAPVFTNGTLTGSVTLTKNDTTNKIGNNGVETYVYMNEKAEVGIYLVEWYVGEVSAKFAATTNKDAYVEIASLGGGGVGGSYTTEDLAVGDVVIYTRSTKAGDAGIKEAQVAKTVSGTLTTYTATSGSTMGSATVDGTTYPYSLHISDEASAELLNRKTTAKVVLDKYDNAIRITDDGVDNYAVVLNYSTTGGAYSNSAVAKLLLMDGTKVDATLERQIANATSGQTGTAGDTLTTADATVGAIVKYTVKNNGDYIVETVALPEYTYNTNDSNITTNKSSTGISVGYYNGNGVKRLTNDAGDVLNTDYSGNLTKNNAGTPISYTSKTLFVVKDGAGEYSVYEGIANVPTIRTAGTVLAAIPVSVYTGASGTVARVVYIDASSTANVSIASNDAIFVLGSAKAVTYDEKIGNYRTYDAIVNGEITKIKVAAAFNAGNGVTAKTLYGTYYKNANDIYTDLSATTGSAVGTEKVRQGSFGTGYNGATSTNYYVPTSDCKVFFIKSDNTITTITTDAIIDNTAYTAWVKTDGNNNASYVFIWEGNTATLNATTYGTSLAAEIMDALSTKSTVNVTGAATLSGTNITIPSGKTVTFDNAVVNNVVITNRGTLTIAGNLTDNGTVYNYNTMTVAGTSVAINTNSLYTYAGATTKFTNANVKVTVSGTLYVESGATAFEVGNSTGSTTASLVLNSGSAVTIEDNNPVVYGSVEVKKNADLSVASTGTLAINKDLTVKEDAAFDVDGTITVAGDAAIDEIDSSAGEIRVTGTATCTNSDAYSDVNSVVKAADGGDKTVSTSKDSYAVTFIFQQDAKITGQSGAKNDKGVSDETAHNFTKGATKTYTADAGEKLSVAIDFVPTADFDHVYTIVSGNAVILQTSGNEGGTTVGTYDGDGTYDFTEAATVYVGTKTAILTLTDSDYSSNTITWTAATNDNSTGNIWDGTGSSADSTGTADKVEVPVGAVIKITDGAPTAHESITVAVSAGSVTFEAAGNAASTKYVTAKDTAVYVDSTDSSGTIIAFKMTADATMTVTHVAYAGKIALPTEVAEGTTPTGTYAAIAAPTVAKGSGSVAPATNTVSGTTYAYVNDKNTITFTVTANTMGNGDTVTVAASSGTFGTSATIVSSTTADGVNATNGSLVFSSGKTGSVSVVITIGSSTVDATGIAVSASST